MRALVTGGAGFLGSHLVDALLTRGDSVLVIDDLSTGRRENLAHAPEESMRLLTLDVAALPTAWPYETWAPGFWPPERIYHLASPASPKDFQRDPVRTLLINVIGTHAMLEVARQTGARFLLASTSEVYGEPEVHPQPEDYRGAVRTTGPRACYDEGKRAAETLTADYRRVHDVETRIARIFNTYGPRMRDDDGRVIPQFIGQALAGKALTVYGGEQTRCLCYVTDTVAGLVSLMEREVAEPVNIGGGEEITMAELAGVVLRLTGSTSAPEWQPLPEDDPTRRWPDTTLAESLLDWRPMIGLEEGLRMVIAAAREKRT